MREISSCSCLTVLPGPAWLLLNKICGPCIYLGTTSNHCTFCHNHHNVLNNSFFLSLLHRLISRCSICSVFTELHSSLNRALPRPMRREETQKSLNIFSGRGRQHARTNERTNDEDRSGHCWKGIGIPLIPQIPLSFSSWGEMPQNYIIQKLT